MAGLNIERYLDNISEIQLGYIKDVLKKQGYNDCKVTIKPVGVAGDNYVANVMRITVEDNGKTFNMIAKIAPNLEPVRLMTKTLLLFKNEHIMYTKVLPKFDELQAEADIPDEQRLRYAACYGSFEEAPNEVILLEDLNDINFKMLDRLKPLSNECVKSVLKNFALLHSLSFALKHKEPELFNEFKNTLCDVWSIIACDDEIQKYFYPLEPNTVMMLENEVHKNAINGILKDSFRRCVKLANSDHDAKSAVILQGDAWTNNIMFKIDGEKIESVMIDYQASKVSNPVGDLHYMLFNCTDYQSRKEHFQDWIDYYHKQLDDNLSAFGLKAIYLFSRDQLDLDMKRYGRLNLGLSLVLASVQLIKPEEAKKMKEEMEASNMKSENEGLSQMGMETIALFKSRVEGLIDSHLELGFL